MRRALELAQQAAEQGEVPVGAVLVRDGEILAEAANAPITHCDPSAHAEILALRHAAAAEKNYRLPGTTLYVTIEPCAMCLGAIIHARVSRVVFGAPEPKAGMLKSHTALLDEGCFNHDIEICEGVLAEACSHQISSFFKSRREWRSALKKSLPQADQE